MHFFFRSLMIVLNIASANHIVLLDVVTALEIMTIIKEVSAVVDMVPPVLNCANAQGIALRSLKPRSPARRGLKP